MPIQLMTATMIDKSASRESFQKRTLILPAFSNYFITIDPKIASFFKKGDFQETWAPFGLVNDTVGPDQVQIPMTIEMPANIYRDALTGDYKATSGRSGAFIGKQGLSFGGP